MPVKAEVKCGDCRNFDTNDVSGNRFGVQRLVNGARGEAGVCRSKGGLTLGLRSPDFPCLKPTEFVSRSKTVVFVSRKPASSQVNIPQRT